MHRVRELTNCIHPHKIGITGQEIGIAVLDTGISFHPDFGDRIVAFHDILHGKQSVYDDCGHGTHVSGICGGDGLASKGVYAGIAPKCRLISLKVLDNRGNGSIQDVLKGLDWIIKNRARYNIRVVNISVGMIPKKGEEEKSAALLNGVDYAWDKGLVVVTAAGNNGPKSHSITIPGSSRKVITVGSSDDEKLTDANGRQKTNYSSRGPTMACVCKPDIVAPGSNITACSNNYEKQSRQYYCAKSGTSMATPVVSGAIAVLLSKYPDMNNFEVKMQLRQSAKNLNLPRNQQGWGILDVDELIR